MLYRGLYGLYDYWSDSFTRMPKTMLDEMILRVRCNLYHPLSKHRATSNQESDIIPQEQNRSKLMVQ